jgi:hypothetical protein
VRLELDTAGAQAWSVGDELHRDVADRVPRAVDEGDRLSDEDVTVRPGAGIPLDKSAVQSAAEAELTTYRLTRSVRTRVRIERPTEKEDEL